MDSIHSRFVRAYREHYSLISYYFNIRTRSSADADDLTHEVFVCFFEALKKRKPIENCGSWLNSTSQNVLNNYRRLVWVKNVICDEDIIKKTECPHTQHLLDLKILFKDIMLQEMNDLPRVIFILIGVYQYTRIEVAQALSLSRHQIEYLYNRSCQTLREALRKRGIHSKKDLT
jgi:RNA polymerase sigma factor (sigma-70 family)